MKAVAWAMASARLRGFPPGLLTGHDREVLAQDLPADRQPLIDREPNEGGVSPIVEWRALGRRVHQDVGIDEAHLPSSSYMSSRRRLRPSGHGPISCADRSLGMSGRPILDDRSVTVIVTSCSPTGISSGTVPEMR